MLSAIGLYLLGVLEVQFARAAGFVEASDSWAPAWLEAANFSDYRLRLDPAGMAALAEELDAVIQRYRSAPPPAADAEAGVLVQLQTFPQASGEQA